jgi:hypothetical protein
MNCQRNINSTLPTQLPHKFSYIVAIFGHNHFESPNTCGTEACTALKESFVLDKNLPKKHPPLLLQFCTFRTYVSIIFMSNFFYFVESL